MTSLFARFSPCFYVQMRESRLTVTDVATGERWDQAPLLAIETGDKGKKEVVAFGDEAKHRASPTTQVVNPFAHTRSLLSDFSVAEKLLQLVFKALGKRRFIPVSPAVIMHPMEKAEGGLSQIEIRAFRELALGAGARSVLVQEGPELVAQNIDFAQLEREQQALEGLDLAGRSARSGGWLVNILFIAGAAFLFWRLGNG